MKTLSTVASNILNTAKETINSPAESQYSLTKNVGKMITAETLAKVPTATNDQNLVAFLKHTLKLPLNLQKKTIFGDYGCEFVDDIELGELTEQQQMLAERAVEEYFKPLPAVEIAKEIARLQIIAPEKEKTEFDMKARTMIWIEELSKYPADVVTDALRRKYRWFPTLAEVMDYCDNEIAFRSLIRRKIRCTRND